MCDDVNLVHRMIVDGNTDISYYILHKDLPPNLKNNDKISGAINEVYEKYEGELVIFLTGVEKIIPDVVIKDTKIKMAVGDKITGYCSSVHRTYTVFIPMAFLNKMGRKCFMFSWCINGDDFKKIQLQSVVKGIIESINVDEYGHIIIFLTNVECDNVQSV